MNADRTEAYRRVLTILAELGPTKLQADEQDRIRFAADTLIFASSLSEDDAAQDALADVRELGEALVDSDRWERTTADRLLADLRACGPPARADLEAA
jgi:hypothetical protein